jgi:hypothetical protein
MDTETLTIQRAPFPWFGGKSRAAELIWSRLGPVANYVEPFAGSLAVLLGRPHPPKTETVNDLDCYLANFWRAIMHAPGETAQWADSPLNEADLHARHTFLMASKAAHRERMLSEPEYFDTKSAGWWVYGQCAWIGTGWTVEKSRKLPHLGNAGRVINRQLPHLGDAGRGINRQLPHLGNAGQGINRQLPHLGNAGQGILDYFTRLSTRLRRVRVACGNWDRVLGESVTWRHGVTGIVFDPPYDEGEMDYAEHSGLSAEVRAWCIANGNHELLRIALCGLEGEHDLPGWDCVAWKARGGYGWQRATGENVNRKRERIWFSPNCLSTYDLFSK